MSYIFDKFFTRILTLIIIIMFIIGFRELILTDGDLSFVLEKLLEMLPFSGIIIQSVCDILKCQYHLIPPNSLISDLIRLCLMASIHPLLVKTIMMFLFPLPSADYRIQEEYMNSFRYRFKEWILSIVTVPLCAIVVSLITSYIHDYVGSHFHTAGRFFTELGLLAIVFFLSLLRLMSSNVRMKTALLWRFCITLLPEMLKFFVTSWLYACVYLSFVNGLPDQMAVSIITLIIWLMIVDLAIKLLQRSIAGTNL